MNLVAVNGSPRKKWNTGLLLEKVVEGAQAAGMDAKLVHLYGLDYKGCTSCFACKRIGGPCYGRCAMRDGLTPLLDEIHGADALVLGSPVYFGGETGMARCFLERAAFQYFTYTNPPGTLFARRIRTAVVYDMGIPEEGMAAMGYSYFMDQTSRFLDTAFGPCERLTVNDTLQFDDYSAYTSSAFDADAKMKRHREVFPQDLARAFDLGKRMAEPTTK